MMEMAKEHITQNSPEIKNFDEDANLMLEVAKGSKHAFRMIVEKWQSPMVNYFYRSCNNIHSAEDMAQQTFVNLYKARQSYASYIENFDETKNKSKFSTYLFHIARNILLSEFRKSSRRPADATDPADMEQRYDNSTKDYTKELEEIFYITLEKLPEPQRTAILLLKQQDLSYEEIANAMSANLQTVKTWISRARATLKNALQESNR